MKNKVAVVIPTIRNLEFLSHWKREFSDCLGIIVEDRQKKEVETPSKYFKKTLHYTWQDIDFELGKNSWIISRRNAGVRSFGFIKALEAGADIIITLDDDCYPVKDQSFLGEHIENLQMKAPSDWYGSYPHRKYPYTRGFPYGVRGKYEVVVSHGLWINIIDLDAKTHIKNKNPKVFDRFPLAQFVPREYFFPLCSMNLAFKAKITPIMYFPPMGHDNEGKLWGFDRFDDIWAGVLAKKIIDHLGLAAISGSPYVEHRQKSSVLTNLKKEKTGIKANEDFFRSVKMVDLKSRSINGCYEELAEKIKLPNRTYFKKLKQAMAIWANITK